MVELTITLYCKFLDDSFKCINMNTNVLIAIEVSLKFVHKGPINNIPALVQIMAWRRPGDKPLHVTTMVNLLTRPQWVNDIIHEDTRTNTRTRI